MRSFERDRLMRELTVYGLASLPVAAASAVQISSRLNGKLRDTTRLGVHCYDLALVLGLGCCVAIPVWGWGVVSRQWDRSTKHQATILAQVVVGGCLGAFFLASDFANFIGKHDLHLRPSAFGTCVGATAGLGLAIAFQILTKRWQRQILGVTALLVAYYNAAVLPGEYPGIHLLVALACLSVFARATSGWLQCRLHFAASVAFATTIMVAGIAPFLLPPSRVVRQILSGSSGSAVAPFVVRWLPQLHVLSTRRLPVEQTVWFNPRPAAPAIPPEGAPWFAANGAVLFLTVEALRSDVVEGRKHDNILPNLARLRDASLHFTNARSPSPSTLTTVTAILTGKYYSQIHFTEHTPGKVLPITDRSARVPELLSRAGIRTVHVRALWGIGPESGVGRGFDETPTTAKDYGHADQVMDLILAELARLKDEPRKRLFLFSHFVDSHAPYSLGGKRDTPYDSYIAEIELIDRQLGRLLTYLKDNQLASRCLLVVGADHGEAFGEHGKKYHASTVYDEMLRIPLMFLHPALPHAASDLPVSLVDISPTLLDLFGVATPSDFMGQSLLPVLAGRPVRLTRPIAVDSGRRMQALFFDDGIKVLRDLMSGTVQVFDLRNDPEESIDLTDNDARDIEPYIAATDRFFETHTLKIRGWKPPWRSF